MTKRTNQPLILWPLAVILGLLGLVGCGGDDEPPVATRPDAASTDINFVPESCAGHCGQVRQKGACQCDPGCVASRDWCTDYGMTCDPQAIGPGKPSKTCKNRCGLATLGAACQCDAKCMKAGDCCADRKLFCTEPNWQNEVTCPAGQAASLDGKCGAVACAVPVLKAGFLWRIKSLTLLPNAEGCDLDDDGKPNNMFGKLKVLFPEMVTATLDYVTTSGLALVYRDCPGSAADQWSNTTQCLTPLSWLSLPVSADTPLPVQVDNVVWQGAQATERCPSRIQVPVDFSKPAPSAPLWLPFVHPLSDYPVMPIPLVTSMYTNMSEHGVTICGVTSRQRVETLLESLPGLVDSVAFVDEFLKPDMDMDDNGKKESISIAVQIEWEPFDPKDAILLSTGLSTPVSQTEVP